MLGENPETDRATYIDSNNNDTPDSDEWQRGVILYPQDTGYSARGNIVFLGRSSDDPSLLTYWVHGTRDSTTNPGYFVYIGWETGDGNYQYGWVPESQLPTGTNIEDLSVIPFGAVNTNRVFDINDEYNPPIGG